MYAPLNIFDERSVSTIDTSTSDLVNKVLGYHSLSSIAPIDCTFEVEPLTSVVRSCKEKGVPVIIDDQTLANALRIPLRNLYWYAHPGCQRGNSDQKSGSGNPPMYIVQRKSKGEKMLPVRDKDGNYVIGSDGRKVLEKRELFRYLQVPTKNLKKTQRKIKELILNPVNGTLPSYISGFRSESSPKDTALVHANKRILVSLDLQNFFYSIKEWHVRKVFEEIYNYPKKVCKLLSEILTYRSFVPTGAPTSPAISNLVGYHFFDKQINSICEREGFVMTRFADDITLSTDLEMPPTVKTTETGAEYKVSKIDDIISEISEVLRSCGFRINGRKTKVMRPGKRKYVLGLVADNETPTVLQTKRNRLKCILYNVCQNGFEAEAAKTERSVSEFYSWIQGELSYFKSVDPKRASDLYEQFRLAYKCSYPNKAVEDIPIVLD